MSGNNMKSLLNHYLENITNRSNGNPEFEIRFGTKGIKKITKINYDNVIKKLLSVGFNIVVNNEYTLKMAPEFTDKSGKTKISNVRTEIEGLYNIQKYCESNALDNIPLLFNQKSYVKNNDEFIYPVDVNEYNLRVSYQLEKLISEFSPFAEKIKSTWKDSKKIFRYTNRVSLIHDNYPIRVDLTIVKESLKEGKYLKPEYTFQTANILNNEEKYEIEMEILNDKIGIGTSYNEVHVIEKMIKKIIKFILSGLQETNYPISYNEISMIEKEYASLFMHSEKVKHFRSLYSNNFIGPSSYTLQLTNVLELNDDSQSPNIRKDYTVTDKADGMRKLLYISSKGKIYLIDTNMNIQFTGAIANNVDYYNTLLDGEHILHNKKGEFINLYAAFDVYFINKKNIRNLLFIPETDLDSKSEKQKKQVDSRLPLLVTLMKDINAISIIKDELSPIRIENKKFKSSNLQQNIFDCCNTILNNMDNGSYEYETDGLIFTPSYLGVGCNDLSEKSPLYKTTWNYSFKWKPPQFNTIDFLVTTKKNESNQEIINNIFVDGINNNTYDKVTQYKTLILRVGFDEKKHGYLNPCGDVINGNLPSPDDIDDEESYKPMPFIPTNPYDETANICNIKLEIDKNGSNTMFTTENEVIEDNMIVEFSYDQTKQDNWKWVPLRVRYDKTAEFRKGGKNFGNAYHVANNNWYSIHNPITEEMITTGENIPDDLSDDDVYYNRVSGKSHTRSLRDFHNLFVKKFLIQSISVKGNTLIDYAVGKGGDFTKWIAAKMSFVFGIDISKDNIENKLDGACARYLNYKKQYKIMPDALFVQGNSSLNIKDGTALYTDKGSQITTAVFGEGPKEKDVLGAGVYKQYGKGSEGFNISSIQFALHYFFENKRTLNSFLRNIAECTKLNGYFIGGCYNGEKIFNLLKSKNKGEAISLFHDDKKIWSVTKQYDREDFNNDETSLGYAIDVYQETINKTFREYLVNFSYLERIMENYGFVLLNSEECADLNIKNSVGSFQELYNIMNVEIKRRKKNDYGDSLKMNTKEKQISFYNNYFIFKKIRSVNAKNISDQFKDITILREELEIGETKKAIEVAENAIPEIKAPKKLKKKLKLIN